MTDNDEAERQEIQYKSLLEKLAFMGVRLHNSIKMLAAISSLTSIPVTATNLISGADAILEVLIRDLENVESCSLLLYEPGQGRLNLLSAKGQADFLNLIGGPYNKDLSFEPGEGIAGMVFSAAEPMFINPGAPEAMLVEATANRTRPESLACLPLIVSEKPLGVINISFSAPKPFDPPRRRDLILFCGVVANILQTFILKSQVDEKTAFLVGQVVQDRREIKLRRHLEQALREAQEDLEARANDRTRELMAAREAISKTMAARKRAVTALQEAEEKYRRLLERLEEGVFLVQSGQVKPLNDKARILASYRLQGNPNVILADIVQHEDQARVSTGIPEGTGRQIGPNQVNSFTDLNGRTHWMRIQVVPVIHQGAPAGLGVVMDVTEQQSVFEDEEDEAITESEPGY
ncbi:MAG: GAF domain-containing protein [Proteobacteria bacterium]|nr:GAF domain-containing protein [Pseudomonadota bacterium]